MQTSKHVRVLSLLSACRLHTDTNNLLQNLEYLYHGQVHKLSYKACKFKQPLAYIPRSLDISFDNTVHTFCVNCIDRSSASYSEFTKLKLLHHTFLQSTLRYASLIPCSFAATSCMLMRSLGDVFVQHSPMFSTEVRH